MPAEPFRKNLHIVFLVRICYALIFSISVITLFWTQHGLSLLDIFLLQAIFSVAVMVAEIPTGYLADRLGRKRTLLLSSAAAAGAWLFYASAHSFGQFAAAEITLGLAFSLLSGTDDALLYESLSALGETDRYTALEGRQQGSSRMAEGAAALAGGLLAPVVSTPGLMAASALACAVAFAACWGLTEPQRQAYQHPRGTWYGLYKIARFVFLRSQRVRFAVPLMAACSLSTMLGVWLYQPLWLERGVPLWLFGALWAALSVAAGLAGHFASAWEKRLGPRGSLLVLPAIAGTGYLLLACLPGLPALAGAYVVMLCRGLNMPILGRYIHDETYSDKRATVISIQSWLFRISYAALGPGIGWIGQRAGLSPAFALSAGISATAMVLFVFPLLRRLPEK